MVEKRECTSANAVTMVGFCKSRKYCGTCSVVN
ncbi:Uncharacterised protein [Vibrio cholerae]|nr:Uncharacterised protein [Vibrio cholerae]